MKRYTITAVLLLLCAAAVLYAADNGKSGISASDYAGMKFRSLGPAFTSGRISDFAVNPDNNSEYYVAVASGNIWKTMNRGITWKPVFDKYGSYAIGCISMDPENHNVVWAGTGENNSQRALGYGDGVYKTLDGGKSWKNMGLKDSRQIGKILIDPRNTDVVYVAAEGSVWGPGGQRGLFKTTDGGKSWKAVLKVSEHTGISDMVMDPRNPDVIIAASHQRRRHVFTKIDGGPETALYKTTDGGKTWRKLTSGLPSCDKGAIGLAISPANPDYIYAVIEAANDKGGFFRTTDRGETWTKMSSQVTTSPQYYNEIFCDPVDVDKVYSMDTVTKVTEDGGRTFRALGNNARHVDDHALWIDPADTAHLIIGGDGGVYETYDSGNHWHHKPNLPLIQFYRVAVDNSLPFYYVYGGTQDNNSMGGPSRTVCSGGIHNSDWFVTCGGDGFWAAIDPDNPNIAYSESQYGGMIRYDRQSGEAIDIQPQPRQGEYSYRWNWNSPLFISPFKGSRLYCAANKVFKSEDRGNTWEVISPDLTRQIDRNKLPVMDKVWSVDAVAKNASTSLYGTIVSMAESPVLEGLLYAGTDDGLIQVTTDTGENWKKYDSFPGVPEMTYVSDICPSLFDENVLFASFDNRKRDDFTPYILKSEDKGRSWKSIAGNLPKNGTVHTIAQDHKNPDLIFVGTEFGFFFSVTGGNTWMQIKSGLPVISVKDIAVQRRENDIVIATFGRGFYVLDNYTPLRFFNAEIKQKPAHIFPVKDALLYVESRDTYGQGSTFYAAKNPPYGAEIAFYLKEAPKTLRQIRQKKEKQLAKENKPIPYPTWDELRQEDNEEPPYLTFTISDNGGVPVRTMTKRPSKGINRIHWDLRAASPSPVRLKEKKYDPLAKTGSGHLVPPGRYQVSVDLIVRGKTTPMAGPVDFTVVPLQNTTLPAEDRAELAAFQEKAAGLYKIVNGSIRAAQDLQERVAYIRQTLVAEPGADQALIDKAGDLHQRLTALMVPLTGDRTIRRRNENPPVSITSRLYTLAYTHFRSTAEITQTEKDAFRIITNDFAPLYTELKQMLEKDIVEIESHMDTLNAPWTPGRLPVWNPSL